MNTATKPARQNSTAAFMHRCQKCKTAARVEWNHSWHQGTKTNWNQTGRFDHQWSTTAPVKVVPAVGGFRNEAPQIVCRCGAPMSGNRILAIASDHVCDARCTNAKGHVCECSCKGANHGSAFAGMQMIAI